MRVNMQSQISLGLNAISIDQAEEIHLATLEILDRVGVNIFEKETLEMLKQKGAVVDNCRVRIPAWMVQQALATAPCRVALGNRNGERVMWLEKGRVYYGSGSATQYVMDISNGERRLAVKQDVVNAAKVADALPNTDFVMSMSLASDAFRANAFIHEFEAMVLNTVKPILYCADHRQDVEDIIAMAEIVAGGAQELAANPFLVLYAEPSSPLQHTEETIKKLNLCAEKRLPVICGPAVMMGATGPVTAAGALVVANCEILSGLVVHQLKSPGAPFIYGGGIPAIDMRTSICSYGSPEEHLNSAMMVNMAQYYRLPVFTTAGCSDSHAFDQQAGFEAGFSMFAHGLAGSNLIHDMGYMGAGAATSLEMLVLCNETAGMVKHYLKGIKIDPETLALDVIEKVGPGGNFFAEEHTFHNFKKHLFFPELLNRFAYDKWKEAGATTFYKRANQKVRDIIENQQSPQLPKDIVDSVKEIVAKRDAQTA